MNRTGSTPPQNPQGSALILSLIFIAVFAALAAALHTVAGSNIRIADNFRKADLTRSSAESGLEVIRYWLSRMDMSGKIAPGERVDYLASTLQNQLTAAGITNLAPVVSGAIAANGISFSGNAGGVIDGSVINYANRAMELDGNSDLLVRRTGRDRKPAGFVPRIVVYYESSSYAEAAL